MPIHPHDITESERWPIQHRENERRSDERHVAEIRQLAASSHFGNEFTTPFLGGAYCPEPLSDTNDHVSTHTRSGSGGGKNTDLGASTPDIERGVRLLCWTCGILFFVLVIATAIAATLN